MLSSKPTQGQPAGPLTGLLPAVYRYLLAWSGDPAAARRLAGQTLELAHRYPCDAAAQGSPAAWLLGLARYAHTFPAKTRRSRDDSPETALRPDQVELAMVAQLREQLARLPSRSAEALALTYFAGLQQEDVAVILGGGSGDVQKLVRAGLAGLQRLQGGAERAADRANGHGLDALGESLAELAALLAPEQGWLEQIQQGPAAPDPAARARHGLPGAGARRLFTLRRLRSIATWLTPVMTAIILTVCLLANLQAFHPPSPPTPLPSPVAVISTSGTNGSSYAGWLVPPDPNFCIDEQAKLSALMAMPATLNTSILYADPKKSSTDPLGRGWGCRIEITGSSADFPDIDAALEKANNLLSAQGYEVHDRFSCENCVPGNFLFDEYTVGKGLTLVQPASQMQAILTLAWRPPGPVLCPTPGGDVSNPCPTPLPSQRQYALRLTLASGSAQSALQAFLDAWAKRDARALEGLSASFRQRTGSLDGLDRLVGIPRATATAPKLTATILENGSYWLRARVQVEMLSDLALPGKDVLPFQVLIYINDDHTAWQVTEISSQTLFPPSQDTLFWADATGQVIRYSLADGKQEALTGPGSYNPQAAPSSAFILDPPQISPDGDWLSLLQPDTGIQRPATLLIDLGQPGKFVRLPYTVRLAWQNRTSFGDPSELVFFRLDRPRTLYHWAPPFDGEPAVLAQFDQDLLSLAWSPDGKRIAALVDRPSGEAPGDLRPASLETVYAVDGEIRHEADISIYPREPSALDLAWTEDRQEIWLRRSSTAVDLLSGRVSALVFPVLSQQSWMINYSDLIPPNLDPMTNWGFVVSPVRTLMASGIGNNPNLDDNVISVRPVAQPDRILWPQITIDHQFLDWTSDTHNLIAAHSPNQTGAVTRIGALAGQNARIVEDVYWIGIGSQLKTNGSHYVLQNAAQLLPTPDLTADWPCLPMGKVVSCLRQPPGWQVTSLADYSPMVMISNLDFAYPIGWTSTPEGSVILQTYFADGTAYGIDQLAPPDQKGITWEEIQVSGKTAFHKLRTTDLPQDAEGLIFPVTGGYLTIYVEPGGAYTNPVVQRILSSIEFAPGE